MTLSNQSSADYLRGRKTGGFFNRLEASRKYIFGVASVYGKPNDSVIVGAFLVRGQDAAPAFDVAPDFDSFNFTKLDPSKKEDREFVEDQWEQEKPVVVGGKVGGSFPLSHFSALSCIANARVSRNTLTPMAKPSSERGFLLPPFKVTPRFMIWVGCEL